MSRALVLTLCCCVAAGQERVCAHVGSAQSSRSATVASLLRALANAQAQGESLLLREPSEPEATFDAVVLMVDFAKLDSAKKYLGQLLAAKPEDAAILKMREKHGPAVFVKLSNIKELQPESVQLLQLMNAAFHTAATDPSNLDKVIDELSQSPERREAAIIQLRSVPTVAVSRLMVRIADRQQPGDRSAYVAALSRLGERAVPPLLGALESPVPEAKGAVLDALGRLGVVRVSPYLWYPAFGADQTPAIRQSARQALSRLLYGTPDRVDRVSAFGAVAELLRTATEHFRNEYAWPAEDDGQVTLWSWQPAQSTVVAQRLSPEAASLLAGTRFAREALALAPENREAQALYLALRLAGEVHRVGWDQPLPTGPGTVHDLALLCGEDTVAASLTLALRNPNPASAVAALQVFSQIATRHQLSHPAGETSPLLTALNYPDMRVQFAAVSAILQLDPQSPFPGSSRIVHILQRALSDSGTPQAVTIDPDAQRSSTVAGIVRELGYEPLVAKTGRDGFNMAVERGDVELILVHENSIQWELSMTIANLRADARTAGIPIAVYGPDPHEPRIQRLLSLYALVGYVVETTSSADLKGQLEPFLRRLKTPPLTQPQRRAQTKAAAYWFAHIATGRRSEVFDIARCESALLRVATDPDLAADVLFALGAIASPTAQSGLLGVAANEHLKPDARETAALQLAFHIQRFGLLLSQTEVAAVHSVWKNASDPQVKTAFASVVGSLKPDTKEVGRRLLAPPAVAPATKPK